MKMDSGKSLKLKSTPCSQIFQASLSQSMTESYSLTEIKSELSSLKGLLLNR